MAEINIEKFNKDTASKFLKAVLAAGANVNAFDSNGLSAILVAAGSGNLFVFENLFKLSDVEKVDPAIFGSVYTEITKYALGNEASPYKENYVEIHKRLASVAKKILLSKKSSAAVLSKAYQSAPILPQAKNLRQEGDDISHNTM